MFDVPQACLTVSPHPRPFRAGGLSHMLFRLFGHLVGRLFSRFLCVLCVSGLLSSVQAQVQVQVLAAEQTWPGVVSWVSDGDTVWVQDSVGATHKVRLLGIDAPEICQDHGHVAKEALQQLLLGHHVAVQGQRLDDYGRLLARLYITPVGAAQPSEREGQTTQASQDVGLWMVQRGHEWSYRYRNDPGPYELEEKRARAAGLGLFASAQAQRPRDFRRRNGPCHEPWVPHS